MVAITRAEKDAIREKYPDVHIVRTMKHDSKRKHYYMVESTGPMRMLARLRGEEPPKPQRERGGRRDR